MTVKGSSLNSLTQLGVTFFRSEAMGPVHLRFPVGGWLAWVFILSAISAEVGETIQ